jgi:hypothetical protein
MSESDNLRKHALECMRLATDCMQLAGDAPSPALQSHFLRMARVWTTLADQGPSADTQTKNRTTRVYPAHARVSRQQPPVLHQYEVDAGRDVRTCDNLFLEGVEPAVV